MFKRLLSIFTIFAIVVPSMVQASVFVSDNELKVYPDSEVVNFLTSVGSAETRDIIIENTGTTQKTINIIKEPSTPFTIDSSKSIVLAAQSTKTLKVTFEPTQEGNFSDIIRLQHNASAEIKEISLNAHARAAITNQGLVFSTNKVNFEKTAIGQTTTSNFILTNTNSYDVKMYSTQKPSGAIKLESKIPSTIKAGESVEFSASFSPKKLGVDSQYLSIKTTDYKKNYLNVSFVGSATEGQGVYSKTNLIVAQDSLNLGAVKQGTQIMQQIQIKNTGKTTLQFQTQRKQTYVIKQTQNQFSISYPEYIAAGNTDFIKVTYTANKFGVDNETFTIKNNSINLPNLQISVKAQTVTIDSQVILPQAPKTIPEIVTTKAQVKAQAQITNLGYTKNLTSFNPDNKQNFVFGLNLSKYNKPVSVMYTLTNIETKTPVYSIKYNQVLPKNQNFSWNGYNSLGDKVSQGEYHLAVVVKSNNSTDEVSDKIRVQRNYMPTTSHTKSHYNTYKPVKKPSTQNPVLKKEVEINPYPVKTTTPVIKALDESLLTQLSVNPIVATYNQTVKVSLNNKYLGKLSVELLKDNQLVETGFLNRTVRSGFHYEITEFDTSKLQNGTYTIRAIMETANSRDTDTISLYVNNINPGQSVYMPQAAVLANDGPKAKESQLAFFDFFNKKPQPCINTLDIQADSNLCEAYKYAVSQNYISDSQYFRGDSILTRAQAMKMIVGINRLPIIAYNSQTDGNLGYSDLNIYQWYMPYINTLIKDYSFNSAYSTNSARNIIRGYKDGTLRPDTGISRAEFYKMLIKAIDSSVYTQLNTQIDYFIQDKPFTDTLLNKENQWFLPYAQIVKNLTNGTEFANTYFGSKNLGTLQARFAAAQKITRAEVIEFLYLAGTKNLFESK